MAWRRLGWPEARERDEAVSFGTLPWYSVFFLCLLGFHDEYSEKTLSLFALIVCSLAFSSSLLLLVACCDYLTMICLLALYVYDIDICSESLFFVGYSMMNSLSSESLGFSLRLGLCC